MKKNVLLFCLFFVLLLSFGCSDGGKVKEDKEQVELLVSAAASLTDVLTELKEEYEKDHKNTSITFNFGSSGKLAAQIEQGAPADLFLSASAKDMDNMNDKGLIDEPSRIVFTQNSLVLISNKDSTIDLNSFEKIDSAKIDHLAIGEPESVPVGRYTKEVFEHLGLWEPLQSKLVMGSDVRQVLTHVEMGNADLGIVYASDALISDKVKVLAKADTEWHEPIVYPGAIVDSSRHKEEAQEFLEYLMSADGKLQLEKFGFK